jgi:hypothetical protein
MHAISQRVDMHESSAEKGWLPALDGSMTPASFSHAVRHVEIVAIDVRHVPVTHSIADWQVEDATHAAYSLGQPPLSWSLAAQLRHLFIWLGGSPSAVLASAPCVPKLVMGA